MKSTDFSKSGHLPTTLISEKNMAIPDFYYSFLAVFFLFLTRVTQSHTDKQKFKKKINRAQTFQNFILTFSLLYKF